MSQPFKSRIPFSGIVFVAVVMLGSLVSSNSFALVLDKLPSYSISPSLSGLDIAYFAKQDLVKITLYLVNHERFPVLCDAEYKGGPDKVETSEQTIAPGKAIAFTFSYPQVTDSVEVQLVCVKAKSQNNTNADANAAAIPTEPSVFDSKPDETTKPDTVQVPETDLSVKY